MPNPTNDPILTEAIPSAIREGVWRGETAVTSRSGQAIPVSIVILAHTSSDGKLECLSAIMRDITESKQAEAQIRQLAERLTSTLESITDAFLTVDREWRFTFVNHEAEKLLRRTRAELIGKELWTEFPETIGASYEREYRRAMANNEAVEFEEFYKPFDIWLSVRAYPSELGLAVYFRNITETKRITEEIKFKNTILQTQLELSPDGILVVDEVGSVVSYNQQFTELWRLTPQLVSARVDEPVLQAVVEQVENPETFVAHVRYLYEHHDEKSNAEIRLKDGRVIDQYSAPMKRKGDTYYGRVWHFRDITARKLTRTDSVRRRIFSRSLWNMCRAAFSGRIAICGFWAATLSSRRMPGIQGPTN